MIYALDGRSLDALITGELVITSRCIILTPASQATRVATFRSDNVQVQLITEQEREVSDLAVDGQGGISWTESGGPDAQSLIDHCEDEELGDRPSDDDISVVRVALQQGAILVSDDETLRLLSLDFGGRSITTAEFAATCSR